MKKILFLLIALMFLVSNGARALTFQEIKQTQTNPSSSAGQKGRALGACTAILAAHTVAFAPTFQTAATYAINTIGDKLSAK